MSKIEKQPDGTWKMIKLKRRSGYYGWSLLLGYEKESQNEQFVQAVANAINQSFEIKRVYDGCCIPKE